MSRHKKLFVACLSLSLLAAGMAVNAAVSKAAPAAAQLPAKLQKLLTEEMVAVNKASLAIQGALVSGDYATVAKQARAIHDSFILNKQLTKDDRVTLHKALPRGFHILDAQFHARALRLAAVAKNGDEEMANYHFGRLIEQCQTCHARFASKKFPAFRKVGAGGDGH